MTTSRTSCRSPNWRTWPIPPPRRPRSRRTTWGGPLTPLRRPPSVRHANHCSTYVQGRRMGEIVSLSDAIAELVHDGDTVALEGFTHLIPVAAGLEIIRQGRRGLTLVRMTPDIVYDQLIGAGCARKLIFSWGGNPGVGSLPRFRAAVEHGELQIEEHSHAGMANRYVAAAAGLPFA